MAEPAEPGAPGGTRKKRLTPAPVAWRNRIIGSGTETPDQLLANPKNYRLHGTLQQEALHGVLNELGWCQEILVNQHTGFVVDGHLRVMLALRHNQPMVPVKYLDLSEEEEALLLAVLDPIASLADADTAKYGTLLQDIRTGDAAVQRFLADQADAFGLYPDPATTPGDADGTLLQLLDVTMDAPRHTVQSGEAYRLSGRHVLVCAEVFTGWAQWTQYLQGPEWLCCPYPGPFVVLGEKAATHCLLLIQPVPFICGHILDRYSEIYGEDAVTRATR